MVPKSTFSCSDVNLFYSTDFHNLLLQVFAIVTVNVVIVDAV